MDKKRLGSTVISYRREGGIRRESVQLSYPNMVTITTTTAVISNPYSFIIIDQGQKPQLLRNAGSLGHPQCTLCQYDTEGNVWEREKIGLGSNVFRKHHVHGQHYLKSLFFYYNRTPSFHVGLCQLAHSCSLPHTRTITGGREGKG